MAYYDKKIEREDVARFLNARFHATGEMLTILSDSESPDFLCSRPDGTVVGVEITKIEYNPERTEFLESIRAYDGELDNFAIFWAAATTLAKKETKRRLPHWRLPNATILVLDLPEGYRIENWPDNKSYSNEFMDSGFVEVWISDQSSIETHGEPTAIGLFPSAIWGIQGQGNLWGPPYK